jgi:hypothetical protein
MTVEVTLRLQDTLLEEAQRFSRFTHRNVETVLTDALDMIWPMLEDLPDEASYPVADRLSDQEVLELADLKMDQIQNQRLGYLQSKGKISGLSFAERYELLALLQIYQIGQVRKSEGLAEAVRRGLRKPIAG